MSGSSRAILLTLLVTGFVQPALAQTAVGARPELAGPDLTGVYELVPNGVTLPGGFKNEGGPDQVPLQPSALAIQRTRKSNDDLAKLCLPVGPFRMMARERNKIDVYRSPGRITMLFENYFLGHMRTIYLDRPHAPGTTWVGDSIARWDRDALVVETTGFNEYTWLNDAGAPHSDAFHLLERYRLVGGGQYLEVQVTAEDPKTLTRPYGYTRYYERANTEVEEHVCWDDVLTVGE